MSPTAAARVIDAHAHVGGFGSWANVDQGGGREERVVFGSDHPFHDYSVELQKVVVAGLY